jgi:hypothetical protein
MAFTGPINQTRHEEWKGGGGGKEKIFLVKLKPLYPVIWWTSQDHDTCVAGCSWVQHTLRMEPQALGGPEDSGRLRRLHGGQNQAAHAADRRSHAAAKLWLWVRVALQQVAKRFF